MQHFWTTLQLPHGPIDVLVVAEMQAPHRVQVYLEKQGMTPHEALAYINHDKLSEKLYLFSGRIEIAENYLNGAKLKAQNITFISKLD